MMSQTIQDFMTKMPHTIGPQLDLVTAKEMMAKYSIRHLPVQEAGHLVGMLSDRDLKLATAFGKLEDLTVEDLMSQDPYTVLGTASMTEVLIEMSERKFGSVVVTDDATHVSGIFTAVDALALLAQRF